MPGIRRLFAIILFLVCGNVAAEDAAKSLAVIVNTAVVPDSISKVTLTQILLGEVRFWEGGGLVTLLIQAPVSWERDILLADIMQMSEPQYRQFWISKVFRTEVSSGPKVVFSNEMASMLVTKIPGAMAFVNEDEIPSDAKVMKIDGLLPGDPEYPLRF